MCEIKHKSTIYTKITQIIIINSNYILLLAII